MLEFLGTTFGSLLIPALIFMVGLTFVKDNKAMAKRLILVAIGWTVVALIVDGNNPEIITNGCIVTEYIDATKSFTKIVSIIIMLVTLIALSIEHTALVKKDIDKASDEEDEYYDGL